MKTAEANNTQTESRAAANVEQAASQPMVMGDWKQWVFNGEVINNSSEDITVWSDDDGTYTIPAGGNSETWGEDVDHVRDVHGQWWKVGWNTATVDSNGEVSGAECRAPGRGQDCGQLGDYPSPSEDTVQTKLTTNQPNDRFEQEADAIAEKVVSGETAIQRKCTDCEKEDELQMKPLIQLKANSSESGQEVQPWVQQQIESSRGGGQPLPDETRSVMESGMGADFQNVNIHTGGEAVQMNRDLGARAFTVGNDIYFNSGQYSPETGEGKRLLAHELTHTVQQGASQNKIQKEDAPAPAALPDTEERFMLGIGGYSNLYDAELDRRITTVTLNMKVQFNFSDALSPWPSDAAKQTWQNSFINLVENRWSYRYYLIPMTTCSAEPSNVYYARMNVIPVTTNPHYTMNIRYSTTFQGSAVNRTDRTARMDALDVEQRDDIPQIPAEHEFGHMLGLPHIDCDSNADHCYGDTPEEKADVMGQGKNVAPQDYTPFTSTMYFFTGCNWMASHTLPSET